MNPVENNALILLGLAVVGLSLMIKIGPLGTIGALAYITCGVMGFQISVLWDSINEIQSNRKEKV